MIKLVSFSPGAGGVPFHELVVPDKRRFMDRHATRFIQSQPAFVIAP